MTDQVLIQTSETQVRELSPDEVERVSGGGGANFLLGDGSVRFVGTADYKWLTHLDRTP